MNLVKDLDPEMPYFLTGKHESMNYLHSGICQVEHFESHTLRAT